ncbi:MAG: hypothetical protein AMXMBFR45_23740 [Gammaproteobacteria bacterium]|nr:MAG: hypothetical protein EDM71_06220 [Pseudomonadota bacterium]MBC6944386.1 hypothetical protein [Gammaproteobacteria bacterium]MCE7895386.1 hypothetical protein [Gammaproteobacteria bacterium PRO8]MDL1881278.1 hypothetical protein [Gammaproteobacteria bacterium PRO2]MCL4777755.1 hypothetical protein [Gammaproteobacteria bacterium]
MNKNETAAVRGLTLLLSLALPALAAAGEIYGKISFDGAAVGEGTAVAASCGGKTYPAVQTDKAGSYHLVVAETGKCTLTITYKGEAASMSVASYEDAAQADVVLERKDGKLAARRR